MSWTAHTLADDLEPLLAGVATQTGEPQEYGENIDLIKRYDPDTYDPHIAEFMGAYHKALGIVSLRTLDTHGFALSAIVVGKYSGKPGKGFDRLCDELGYELDWQEEQQKVWDHYRTTRK
jgi:hypothetical protein